MTYICTLLVALGVWCGSATPSVAQDLRSLECFASKTQAWDVYPGQHLRHHKTPNGVCWHIGEKNHSGTWNHEHTKAYASTKPLPKKIGSDTWVKAKPTPHWMSFIEDSMDRDWLWTKVYLNDGR